MKPTKLIVIYYAYESHNRARLAYTVEYVSDNANCVITLTGSGSNPNTNH